MKRKYLIELFAYFSVIGVTVAFICTAVIISNQDLALPIGAVGFVTAFILTIVVGRMVIKNSKADPPTDTEK